MSDGSSIEWCDATWTIAVGCTRVSPGCDKCYAATFVHRGLHESHTGLTKLRPKDAARPGVDWNGTVRMLPERLSDPLRWRKPRRVFVGSITDLFHASIPFEYIAAVFGVMAACPQHTFLVLTKRPERAHRFFAGLAVHAERRAEGPRYSAVLHAQDTIGDAFIARDVQWRGAWPLPNVHLGTSVEDQRRADERIPALLECPAALHWVSAEPLLGPVDFKNIAPSRSDIMLALAGVTWRVHADGTRVSALHPKIGWIVVGGESGQRARMCDEDWLGSIVQQCRDAGVPVFVKQHGSNPVALVYDDAGRVIANLPKFKSSKGNDPAEWRADLRVREVPA